MPPTAATSPATTPLTTALTALGAIAHNLTLLGARLNVGARLRPRRGHRSGHSRLAGARVEVSIPRPSLVIAVVIAPISVTPITAASLSLGAPAITMTATLTTFRTARLPGVLPSPVAMPVAATH